MLNCAVPRRIVTLTVGPTLDLLGTATEARFPDLLKEGQVARFRPTGSHIGGKGITCARVLKRLGGDYRAVLVLGDDDISHCIETGLRLEEIKVQPVRTRGLGRVCMVINKADGNAQPDACTDYRINAEPPDMDQEDREGLMNALRQELAGASILVLAGNLPRNARDLYVSCLAVARERGVPWVILDASEEALHKGIRGGGGPDLVKINKYEARDLLERECKLREPLAPEQKAALDMFDLDNPAHLAICLAAVFKLKETIVTSGAAGAVATEGNTTWQIPPAHVVARNALGAGDSFTAGLAYGLAESLRQGDAVDSGFAEALRWGAACGAATAERPTREIGDRTRADELRRTIAPKILDLEGLKEAAVALASGWQTQLPEIPPLP